MSDRDAAGPDGIGPMGVTVPRAMTAGDLLRQAREDAGLSLDAISQQLKLSPRQVKALEDGDFAALPGRTFVRGFVRNYARVMQLDPQVIVDALPGSAGSSALEAPPLNPTAVSIGELPIADKGGTSWARWMTALIVLAILATASFYALRRGELRLGPGAAMPGTGVLHAPDPGGGPAGGSLPNPLLSSRAASGAGAPASALAEAQGPGAAPDESGASLTLTLHSPSWVEVKDGSGRVVISQMLPAGPTQPVAGTPPFDLVIGNAPEVAVTFRGQPVDLAPFTRQNVARITLQ